MTMLYRCTIISLLALAGCTASKGTGRTTTSGGEAAQVEEKISNRAKLLFEDANKAAETQRKANAFDYPSLERKYRAAADADRNFAEPVYNLGVLAERQGKLKDAVGFYREALDRKPTLRQAAENLAVIAQNSGDTEGAVRIYEEMMNSYPDDASSRARLAEIYRQRGEKDRAIELAREALFREPKTLTAYKVMMRAYLDQRQLSMAKLVALRAMLLDENDVEILYTLGLINLAEKEPAKARVQFKKAVAIRSDYLPAHLQLARMALQQENYAGVEESIRRILQNSGKSAEALVTLGIAYKGMGQLDKAMQAYDEAQGLNPNLPHIYLNRGIIIALKGDPVKAKEYYQQFIAMAGGEVAVPGDHAVFALIRDADEVLAQREQERLALEEAKRMEEEMKKAEAAAKEEERRQKEEEFQQRQKEAKGGEASKPEAAKPGEVAKAAAPAAGTAAKKDEKKPTPAKKESSHSGEEPSDEPG